MTHARCLDLHVQKFRCWGLCNTEREGPGRTAPCAREVQPGTPHRERTRARDSTMSPRRRARGAAGAKHQQNASHPRDSAQEPSLRSASFRPRGHASRAGLGGRRVRDPGRPQGRTGLGPRAREPCPEPGLRESRVGARPGSGGTRPERGGKGRRLKVKVKKRPRQPLATFPGTSGGLTGVPTGGQTAAGLALGIFRAGVRRPGPPKTPQPTAATRAPGLAPRASTPSPGLVTPPSGTPLVSRCPRLLATPARRRAGP